MATITPNYELIKPDYSDPVDIDVLNDNADKIDSTLAAKANLVGGKVPASELPSYVDDVIEGYYYNGAFYEEAAHTTQITPETGKIYIDLSSENCYRWSGSVYVQISSPESPILWVNFTYVQGVYDCDTDLPDMFDALSNGQLVLGMLDDSQDVMILFHVGNWSDVGDYIMFFAYNSSGEIAELFGLGSGAPSWSYQSYNIAGGGGGSLPAATTLGDVPSWNPGTQTWQVTPKGSVSANNTGYVIGGDVYTVVGNVEAALAALIGGES